MLPAGYRLIEVEETASTNTACLDAARAGDPGRLWIRAGRQLAGRGSRGRSWVSEPGNLYASLLLIDPGPPAGLANLAFVAALALREALGEIAAAYGVACDITLKWPNDVLLSGRKVSGILLENHGVDGHTAVIVGIGVNCASHPPDSLYPTTDLAGEGMPVPPRDLMELIAAELAAGLERWDRGAGFDDIRRSWLQHASGLGQRIVVRLPSGEMSGIFDDIDERGFLVLNRDDGTAATVSAADVFFRAPVERQGV